MEFKEKLARWAGVTPFPVYPTGYDYPDFTSSLDTIFEHLIPEIDRRHGYDVAHKIVLKWICALSDYGKAAEELCVIIEQLVDEEAPCTT